MTTEIFLDLEGTIIDDLESCTFLDKNCEKICTFISYSIPVPMNVHIFTWGLLTKSDFKGDLEVFIENIRKRIGFKIKSILTKEDSLLYHAGLEGKRKIKLSDYEVEMYDKGFTKEQSFIEMFKVPSEKSPHILIDDSIIEPKTIYFHKNKKFIFDYNYIFPHITLVNPSNL